MKRLRLLDKTVFFLNIVFATLLLLSYILPFIPPKTAPILSVLSLGVPLLIVINIIFVLYWLLKVKKQLLFSLVILIIGYLSFGSMYKFSSLEENKNTSNLSVMSFNVRLFNLYNWIENDSIDEQIINLIHKESPDVLSLQEYNPRKETEFNSYNYKFEKLIGNRTKTGQVIFSKFPIINSGSIEFPHTTNNAIFIDIVKKTDTLRIYNIHLESLHINTDVENLKKENSEKLLKRASNTFKMQQFQTELFLLHKKQCKYKMIICGDFNNTAFSYVYNNIKGKLNDAFKEAGNGFGRTFNFKFFPVRIDFILTDKTMQVNTFKTYSQQLSDHYPIMATLNLNEDQ